MERIVASFQLRNDIGTAVGVVEVNAFDDVIPRFHNLAGMESIQGKLYRFDFSGRARTDGRALYGQGKENRRTARRIGRLLALT